MVDQAQEDHIIQLLERQLNLLNQEILAHMDLVMLVVLVITQDNQLVLDHTQEVVVVEPVPLEEIHQIVDLVVELLETVVMEKLIQLPMEQPLFITLVVLVVILLHQAQVMVDKVVVVKEEMKLVNVVLRVKRIKVVVEVGNKIRHQQMRVEKV
jgi:hypothetical protein